MKLLRHLILPAAFAAFALSSFANFSWDFSKATGANGAVEVPEASGQFALVFASGASVGTDAGKSVLVLDGTQKDPGQTARAGAAFPLVEITMRFKPAGTGPERQTVLGFGNAYELRYNTKGTLDFIIYYPEKKYSIAQVKAPAGQWHDVKAVYQGGKVSLTVGKTTKELSLPPGSEIDSKGTRVRVGRQGERAFIGSIAELSIK